MVYTIERGVMKNRDFNREFDTEELFYDAVNCKREVSKIFDSKGRLLIINRNNEIIEINTFYKDGLTLRSRFIMHKTGDSGALYRKVGYNEAGIKIYETDYKEGAPAEVKQYDKNGAPISLVEYKNSKVQFIATRDDKDRGVWHRDFHSGEYIELQESQDKEI